jgi:anti-sigma factor RsiW
MSAYVDGELTGAEMLEIRRHMSECPDCAEEHESIRFTKMAVAGLRTAAPRRDMAESIMRMLDEVTIPRHQRLAGSMLRFVHEKLSPVAAALAVSGAALVIMSAGGVDRVHPQSANVATVQALAQETGFLHGLRENSVAFSETKPLKLAPELGGSAFVSASLVTR